MFYAIKRRCDGQYVTGTDSRLYPYRQICNPILPPLILTDCDGTDPSVVDITLKSRGVNLKKYELVAVEIKEVKLGLEEETT